MNSHRNTSKAMAQNSMSNRGVEVDPIGGTTSSYAGPTLFRLSPLSPFETSKLVLNRASVFNSMPKKANLAPRRHPGRAAVAVGKDLCGRSEPGPMPVRASEPPDINAAGPRSGRPGSKATAPSRKRTCGLLAIASAGRLNAVIRDAGLAFGGFFFGTQRFDFSLSLIGRASALYRIGSGLGFDAAGRGKRYPVGEVAALARAKQGARYPLHAAVEQPTDSPGAVAAERGGYLVHLLEPSRWQANANHRSRPVRGRPRFRRRFFIEFWLTKNFPLATRKSAAFAKMQQAFLVALVAQHLRRARRRTRPAQSQPGPHTLAVARLALAG
jgi:hypothetical protein